MWPPDRCPAHHAGVPLGVRRFAAGFAVEELRRDFAVGLSVSGINLEDLLLNVVLRQLGMLPQELPHRLTGKGESVDVSLDVGNIACVSIRFGLRLFSSALGTVDFGLLVRFPEHGGFW